MPNGSLTNSRVPETATADQPSVYGCGVDGLGLLPLMYFTSAPA